MAAKSRWLDGTVAGIWIAVGMATAWSGAWRIPVGFVKTAWIRRTSDESRESLEAEGRRLVTSIQAFEARAGRPPESLDEPADLPDDWQDWSYRVDEEGKYSLSIAAGKPPFVQHYVRYDSRDDRWSYDA